MPEDCPKLPPDMTFWPGDEVVFVDAKNEVRSGTVDEETRGAEGEYWVVIDTTHPETGKPVRARVAKYKVGYRPK